MLRKRRKSSRHRGTHTHGWGGKKKHRGAGSRGGRGKAGTGKRADVKKPSYEKKGGYLGKWGFSSKSRTKQKAINLRAVNNALETWAKKGIASKDKDTYKVDLGKMGFTKLLSGGKLESKVEITVGSATERAAESVKKAGGKVNLPAKKEIASKEEKPKPAEKEE